MGKRREKRRARWKRVMGSGGRMKEEERTEERDRRDENKEKKETREGQAAIHCGKKV